MANPLPTTVDQYIAAFPPGTQRVLDEVRSLIRAGAPGVVERISYGIAGFELRGRILLYLAGWKRHISLYPVTAGMSAVLGDQLAPYQTGKGTLQFPLSRELPKGLIRRIVEVRANELP
jgi:uncharacterized protein YdhG (YjbR/CyaY superfamily)